MNSIDKPSFFQEFLDVVNTLTENDTPKIENNSTEAEKIKILSVTGTKSLRKPQRILHDDVDFYIAVDMVVNVYYMCFRYLLMVDVDFYKTSKGTNEKRIIQMFTDYGEKNSLLFRLYKTRNGIHAFVINKMINYRSDEALKIMIDLKADFYYTLYSYIRGSCVRLNRKANEEKNNELYTYISDVGNGTPIDVLDRLVHLHIKMTEVFKDVSTSIVKGK